jgi:hypothetical protein
MGFKGSRGLFGGGTGGLGSLMIARLAGFRRRGRGWGKHRYAISLQTI